MASPSQLVTGTGDPGKNALGAPKAWGKITSTGGAAASSAAGLAHKTLLLRAAVAGHFIPVPVNTDAVVETAGNALRGVPLDAGERVIVQMDGRDYISWKGDSTTTGNLEIWELLS